MSTTAESRESQKASRTRVDNVVVRFAGDSGDGMQLTGTEFTKAAATAGNDIATLPDFPAEIRAPAGSLAGVSGFQVHFASGAAQTPGDEPDVLVAMNPAALRANLADLPEGGILIANIGAFTKPNLKKAGYDENPLENGTVDRYRVYAVDISKLTTAALDETDLSSKEKARCKNFFALGLMFWMYSRDPQREVAHIEAKFASKPRLADANARAFKAGYYYGETAEVFQDVVYEVEPAAFEPGVYRNISGNEALALGLVAAGQLADKPVFYSGYPITPASTLLHSLSGYKHYGVTTFQAEDEIAGVGAAIGAAYGGHIAVTASSGPGIALKAEGVGLAAMTEVPLVIVDVQRGGPSTGLPTKTEQSDLLQVLFGRNGECPLPVLAASTPSDAFDTAIEAVRIAITYVTPVVLLSDGYIANGAEPWRLPDVSSLPAIASSHRRDPEGFQVYQRDPETLARDWVVPGTPGLEHRIGGLEKDALTGNVSYDPLNHERMTHVRSEKVERVAREIGPLAHTGPDEGDVLVVGWGGTYGALRQAAQEMQRRGHRVAHTHLRYMNPLGEELGERLSRFRRVLVPELNMGQLRLLIRARYLVDAIGFNKVQGQPFKVSEVVDAISDLL